ncbi:hypothetical protein DITRI_Ditri03aG0214700 [Diplodiscus trichospermus]
MSENKPQSDTIENRRVTWEGCSVLLDINDGDRLVFARLSSGLTLKIGNKTCSLQPLIGCPFGSLFQVESGKETPYLSRFIPPTEENNVQDEGSCQLQEESRDNRAIIDNNQAQCLTDEDIGAMRRQGATGNEIVEALIANSSTFEKKTQFSQEKYRLKKQKKYAPRLLLRRPCSRSICEAYFKKYPSRIGFLRVDALSLLLSMANITANSDVLVVDMVGGLLTGAVAERLGELCAVHSTTFVQPKMELVSKSANMKMSLWRVNLILIIAAPEQDAWSLVNLLPLLSFSAPFAIYHQYLQPLATCMRNLQLEKMAIGLQISEPWLREYQVLPSRTHPCMQMSGSGGYILSGTRTFTSQS